MNDADRKLEETLADLGVPGPRVTLAMVEEILATVTYSARVVEGTTSTVAVAILPSGFVLATGLAVCVARENFNPALGIERAISKARDLAREAIWQHEGYRLSQAIHEGRQGNASAALKQIRTVLGSQAEANELHRHSLPKAGLHTHSINLPDEGDLLRWQRRPMWEGHLQVTVDSSVPADTVAVMAGGEMVTAIRTVLQDAGASE